MSQNDSEVIGKYPCVWRTFHIPTKHSRSAQKTFSETFSKNLFFFENPFFLKRKIDQTRKKRKLFLCTSGMLCRCLTWSSDSGLSFDYFRMILGHFWEILLIKNEKLTIFAKRCVAKSFCKGLKKRHFDVFFDFKCL